MSTGGAKRAGQIVSGSYFGSCDRGRTEVEPGSINVDEHLQGVEDISTLTQQHSTQ